MEQKILSFVSPRMAWIILAGCVAFWLASAADLLEAPPGTPSGLTFLWLYANLMLALASTLVAVGAVAVLVLHRRAGAGKRAPAPTPREEGPDRADTGDAAASDLPVNPPVKGTRSAGAFSSLSRRSRAQRR